MGPQHHSFAAVPWAHSPFSTAALTMLAVPSGRRVRLLPPRSVKVYISFSTISVVSPTPRAKSSVCSKRGRCTSENPKSAIVLAAVFTT